MSESVLREIAHDDGPLATLGRMLVLGMPQPCASVVALSKLGVDGVVALGLATADEYVVRPAALVRPQSFADEDGVGEWWIASDLDEVALDVPLPGDHVLGVGGTSRTLAEIVVPVQVERALDLGTGCGYPGPARRAPCRRRRGDRHLGTRPRLCRAERGGKN